jgi:hypothetical protein
LSWDFTVRESQIRSISFCLTTDGLTRVGLCRIPAFSDYHGLANYRVWYSYPLSLWHWTCTLLLQLLTSTGVNKNFDYMEIDGTGWSASGPVRDRGVQQEKDEN